MSAALIITFVMKQIALITLCTVILLASFPGCNKSSTSSNRVHSDSILGSWELLQRGGGMTPAVDYPAGNGNLIKFTSANYELYKHGEVIKSGSYVVVNDSTVKENVCLEIPPGKFTRRIIYDSSYASNKMFIHVSEDTLTFISGCYAVDAGQSSVYKRQAGNQ